MLFTEEQREALLAGVEDNALARARAPLQETLSQARGLDPINRVSYLETRCYMLNTLLRDSDVMNMAHGLELRVPLIDVLAAKVLAMPGAWKLDSKMPKPLLVGALKGALPDEIVHRKKQGFTLPFEKWMGEVLRTDMKATLGEIEGGPLSAVLRPKAALQLRDGFLNQRTSWACVWSLYVLERWCEMNSVTAAK